MKSRCVIGERKLIASMREFVEAQQNDVHDRPPINGAFRVVNGTALTLVDQIQLFHAASIVVGPHGAGLTNAMFMKKGSVLMEFPVRTYQGLRVTQPFDFYLTCNFLFVDERSRTTVILQVYSSSGTPSLL